MLIYQTSWVERDDPYPAGTARRTLFDVATKWWGTTMRGYHVESRADIVELIFSNGYKRILTTGIELDVFEAIGDTPRTADDLSRELNLDAENAYRLFRALASMGLLDEGQDRQFSLTPHGELLQSDHPESVRGLALSNKGSLGPRAEYIPEIVRDGSEPWPQREYDMSFFELFEADSEFAQGFNDAMDSYSKLQSPWIREMFAEEDFQDASKVCDIGGGRGLISLLLQDRPHLEGMVLEVPSVVEEQDRRWPTQLGVDNRVSYVAGDMSKGVPTADCHVMKYILHDWSDESCKRILSSIHEDAPADARFFTMSHIIPEDGSPHVSKNRDIHMMVDTGGRERTLDEFDTLFEATGWERVDVRYPENRRIGAIEATKT